jgi:Ca2+-transporting ATPase
VATLGIFNYTLRTSGNVEHARNLAFVTLITSELLRAYTSRSEEYSIFEIGLFSNKYMVCGTILSFLLVLLVVYIPSLRLVFETEYVTLSQWIRIVAFAIIPSIAAEITKLMTRKRQPV